MASGVRAGCVALCYRFALGTCTRNGALFAHEVAQVARIRKLSHATHDGVSFSMTENWHLLIYFVPLLFIWAWYLARRRRTEARSVATRAEAEQAGLIEPVSLHPMIDPNRCLGCGACIAACPEQPERQVLGLIGGKAQLVSPTDCIGHGACKAACPTGAITLVFGTERRGVSIPLLSPEFESSVPGVFIAGELGGMGLIRNALSQGCQAIEAMHSRGRAPGKMLEVLIVGAGPAGFAAALTATALKMRFTVIEQESLGGCVFQYPRGKIVMTAPAELPLVGTVRFSNASKEELLKFWQKTEAATGLKIRYGERVVSIDRSTSGTFLVRTTGGTYETRYVLLAVGRRGTPRKLGVPGEELSKVVYRLIDPEQYTGKNVLVVGGGDSALESAAGVAELPGSAVALSYRGETFLRAKTSNRDRVARAVQRGQLEVLMHSNVIEITPRAVTLEQQGRRRQLRNDAVIVQAGGVLPNELLQSVGIQVEMKYGTA